jgi:5-methylcytosine-specific restriction enzyme A
MCTPVSVIKGIRWRGVFARGEPGVKRTKYLQRCLAARAAVLYLIAMELPMALKQVRNRLPAMKPRLPPMKKRAMAFYTSAPWRELVARLLRERGPYCSICGVKRGQVRDGGQPVRIIADHRTEIKDGGDRLAPSNIDLMCQGCHNRKTADARARRVSGGA